MKPMTQMMLCFYPWLITVADIKDDKTPTTSLDRVPFIKELANP